MPAVTRPWNPLLSAALLLTVAPWLMGQTEIYNLQAGSFGTVIVKGVGDVNNDGYGDFAAVNTMPELIVFSGRDGSRIFTLQASLLGGGIDSVAGIGDTDGDGRSDIAVGNAGASITGATGGISGLVTLISGGTGQVRWRTWGNLGDRLGKVSWVGDINGDLVPDVLATKYYSVTGLSGYVVVLSGVNGVPLLTVASGPLYQGGPPDAKGTGDMDGDGVPDFIVATPPLLQSTYSGSVRGFSGANGAVLFTATSQAANDNFGVAIDAGGDIDGDGRGDFLVAGGGPYLPVGRIWAISGATGQVIHTLTGPSQALGYGLSPVVLSDLNGDGRAEFTTRAGYFGPWTFPIFSGMDGSILMTATSPWWSPIPPQPPGVQSVGAGGDIYPDGKAELLWGMVEWPPIGGPSRAAVRVISFAPVAQASSVALGIGCGGLGPVLAMQPPVLGTTPWLGLWNAAPISPGFLFLSVQTASSIPVGGGCTVYLDPATLTQVLSFTTDGGGVWVTQIGLGQGVVYAGLLGRLQAAVVPVTGLLQLTNAVDFTLGY